MRLRDDRKGKCKAAGRNRTAAKPAGAKKRGAQARSKKSNNLTVFTVGHSTRTFQEFLALLKAHGIKRLVDIRSIPRSRHTPQFNRETLAERLRSAGLNYLHLKKLGGRRHAKKDSGNLGWHNASFRGFADYMQTPEFGEGLQRLLVLAKQKPTAIMCAEAVPWRCHRSLVGDALVARGIEVEDIFSATVVKPHKLTPFARVRGTTVTYPASALTGPRGLKRASAAGSRRFRRN